MKFIKEKLQDIETSLAIMMKHGEKIETKEHINLLTQFIIDHNKLMVELIQKIEEVK